MTNNVHFSLSSSLFRIQTIIKMANSLVIAVLCIGLASLATISQVTCSQDVIKSDEIDVHIDPNDPNIPLLADLIGERYKLLQLFVQTPGEEEPILSYSPDNEDNLPQSSASAIISAEEEDFEVVNKPILRKVFKRLQPEIQILIRMAIMKKLQEQADLRSPLSLGDSIGMRFKKAKEDFMDEIRHKIRVQSDRDSMEDVQRVQKRPSDGLSDSERAAVRSAVLDILLNNRKSVDLQGMRGGR